MSVSLNILFHPSHNNFTPPYISKMPSKKSNVAEPEEPDTTINPYTILSITPEATASEIKTAYRRAALANHPDKVTSESQANATASFQRIAFAYAILSDPIRRKRYDATGSTSDSILDDDGNAFDWLSFYRSQFADVITVDALDAAKLEYQKSDEEHDDLLAAFIKSKGRMRRVFELVMHSYAPEDEERFRTIIDAAIVAGVVEGYHAYVNEKPSARQRRVEAAQGEAVEAEAYGVELAEKKKVKLLKPKAKEMDLAAMIQSNQKKRAGFLDGLEAKYMEIEEQMGKKKRRVAVEEPPEEAFKSNRERGKKQKLK